MKKYIANIITVSRILFSLPLLFVSLTSAWFYTLYLLCGFTDMIDGVIARKVGVVSQFGARLDTAADFIFMFVCSVKVLPLLHLPVCLWVWIVLLALIKIFNIAFVFICRKTLLSIHSVLNKIAGFALFLLPLTLNFVPAPYGASTVCALVTVAVIQEVYLTVKGQEVL